MLLLFTVSIRSGVNSDIYILHAMGKTRDTINSKGLMVFFVCTVLVEMY